MNDRALRPVLLGTEAREVLLLELSIDLGTLLQFSASVFRAIRTSLTDPSNLPKQGLVTTLKDVLILSELLHEVHLMATPIAQGRYACAAAAATSIARRIAEVASDPELPLDQCGYDQRQVLGMLRRWGQTLSPSLQAGIETLTRLADTCMQLEKTYVQA